MEQIDLFEHYDQQPPQLREILDRYSEQFSETDWDFTVLAQLLEECEVIGFTFEYGLDAIPLDLRPIQTV